MKVVIISGSQRFPSQSRKTAEYLMKEVRRLQLFEETALIDLGEKPLPMWDQGVWTGDENWKAVLEPLTAEMRSADAYILITPEWNGAVTPAVKNFSLFFGERVTGHKPVLAVSVSAGPSGQYPIAELRSAVFKNNKWVFIPDHLVIRFVEKRLIGEEPADESDALLRDRIVYSLRQLQLYAGAMTEVRRDFPWDDRFKYGM